MENITSISRVLLMLIPFLIPVLGMMQEELLGRVMWFRYMWAALFILSLIALYALKMRALLACPCKVERNDKLILFHLFKIPLFVVSWLLCMLGLSIICFLVSGFEGIQ